MAGFRRKENAWHSELNGVREHWMLIPCSLLNPNLSMFHGQGSRFKHWNYSLQSISDDWWTANVFLTLTDGTGEVIRTENYYLDFPFIDVIDTESVELGHFTRLYNARGYNGAEKDFDKTCINFKFGKGNDEKGVVVLYIYDLNWNDPTKVWSAIVPQNTTGYHQTGPIELDKAFRNKDGEYKLRLAIKSFDHDILDPDVSIDHSDFVIDVYADEQE